MKIDFGENTEMMFNGRKIEKIDADVSDLHFVIKRRYAKECTEIAVLANRQLNLEKNAKKGDFEDLPFYAVSWTPNLMALIDSELSELKNEIFDKWDGYGYYESGPTILREKINYQRAREEIGDVAACLVGLLAKLNKMEGEEK